MTARLSMLPRVYAVTGNSTRLPSLDEMLRQLPEGIDMLSHLSGTLFVHRAASWIEFPFRQSCTSVSPFVDLLEPRKDCFFVVIDSARREKQSP